jgi:hypothetical protein
MVVPSLPAKSNAIAGEIDQSTPKEQPPRKLSGKRTALANTTSGERRRKASADGIILSGKETEGAQLDSRLVGFERYASMVAGAFTTQFALSLTPVNPARSFRACAPVLFDFKLAKRRNLIPGSRKAG